MLGWVFYSILIEKQARLAGLKLMQLLWESPIMDK